MVAKLHLSIKHIAAILTNHSSWSSASLTSKTCGMLSLYSYNCHETQEQIMAPLLEGNLNLNLQ